MGFAREWGFGDYNQSFEDEAGKGFERDGRKYKLRKGDHPIHLAAMTGNVFILAGLFNRGVVMELRGYKQCTPFIMQLSIHGRRLSAYFSSAVRPRRPQIGKTALRSSLLQTRQLAPTKQQSFVCWLEP